MSKSDEGQQSKEPVVEAAVAQSGTPAPAESSPAAVQKTSESTQPANGDLKHTEKVNQDASDIKDKAMLAAPIVTESLSQFKDYAPFIYNVGSRAFYGAAWGGLFGLLLFKRGYMRKFSVLYGAGFGLGMCAPQINQLRKDFFNAGPGKELAGTPCSDDEFYTELDSIKQEIVLRNKFRH